MNEIITVIVPSCPSGFKPYPELTIEATVEKLRIIATCLRTMERTHEPICKRLSRAVENLYDCLDADEPMYQATTKALAPYWYITAYLLQDDWPNQDEEKELYTTLRSTWIDHIERSIWEQIGH